MRVAGAGIALLVLSAACSNEPPSPSVVHVEPASPDTSSDLVLVIDAAALDFEGADIRHRIVWTSDRDGAELEGETLPAANTERGDTWTATVRGDDGRDLGAPTTVSVLIVNAVPVVSSARVVPDVPDTSTPLSCAYEATDADLDTLTPTYAWFVNGATSATTETLATSRFDESDTVACEVTVSDGEARTTLRSADVRILDAPPVIDDLVVSPTKPSRGHTVVANVSASDFDGDWITLDYRWYVGDLRVGDEAVLDAFAFSRGDKLRVEVTPSDGKREGETRVSVAVTVVNALPEVLGLALSQTDAVPGDLLTATYTPVEDYDGDPVTVTRTWEVNGATRTGSGDSFDTTGLARGDTVGFRISGADSAGSGPASVATVVLGNRAPAVASASLSPSTITRAATPTCSAGKATDPDGDRLTYRYEWWVNSKLVGSAATLAATAFRRGDTIYCKVYPNDGAVEGTPGVSKLVTVENAAPTAPAYEITYESATTWDMLTCGVSTPATDADGDTLTYTYAWSLDGYVISDEVDLLAEAEGNYTCTGDVSDGIDTTDATEDSVDVADYSYAGAISSVDTARIDGYATSLGTFAQRGAVGDFTGDGTPDLMVSSSSRGVYLFTGPLSSVTYASARGYATCATTTGCGAAFESVDFLGTGTENIVVGHTADATGATGAGAIWLLPTAPSSGITLSTTYGRRLYGSTTSAAFGSAISAGDFDGDGYEDLFASAPGANVVYGVEGGSYWTGSQAVTSVADWVVTGTSGTSFGTTITADLDSDGDGYAELLVSTTTAGGAVYLFHGPGTSSSFTLSSADATFTGTSTSAVNGTAIVGGDFDQSGAADIAISSSGAGTTVVFLDPSSGAYTASYASATITGGSTAGTLGASLAAGDFDADGADDLVVGAPTSGTGATGGRAVMYFGPNLTGSLTAADADIDLTSSTSSDSLGNFVRMADFDGDDEWDIVVGVPGLDAAGTNYGGVYLIGGD